MERQSSSEEIFTHFGRSNTTWLPRRYLVALLSFFGFANIYAMRVNLSVAIVVMTQNRTITLANGTKLIEPPEFDWGNGVEGVVLSSFFYGYILTQVMGGWLACKYGGKNLFGLGVGVTSLFTLLTPFFAWTSVYLLVIGRVIEGLFEGVTFPAIYGVWSKWSPPEERSRLVAISYSGCYFGTVAALPLCGALAERLGWPSIFYVFGFMGSVWTVIWLFIISETPSNDKFISEAEKEYIEDSLGTSTKTRLNVPWKDIFRSLPVWAIVIAHFSENWGFYTLLTELPSYMNEVFKFNFHSTGFTMTSVLAALPYLAMGIIVQTSGFIADWLRTTGYLTTLQVRKLFTCIGFITRALFLLAAAHSQTRFSIVASLIVAVGFGGLAYAGFSVNHLDIAPQYASILMGLSNTFATLPGILSPMLTSYIVQNKTPAEWQTIFHIAAAVYVFGAIIYGVWASGKIQNWAQVGQEQVFLSDNEQSQTSTEDLLPVPPPSFSMCEELRLERYDNSPWGFRLTGGLDFGTPLSIIKVTGGSIAEEAGVQAGDLLKTINGKPTTHFTHLDAQKCITSAGNYLTLTVIRGSIVTPPSTPLQRLSPAPNFKPEENGYIPHDSPTIMKTQIENNIMDYYKKECDMRDGSRSPAPVYQKTVGQKAFLTKDKSQYRVNE